jgi:arabinogalactan endo-1,4-beta-galactosidase
VIFKNRDRVPQDIFTNACGGRRQFLRVRVWNRPFSKSGRRVWRRQLRHRPRYRDRQAATLRGLGCILISIILISGRSGETAGASCLEGLPLEDKANALYAYTREAIERALDAGVDVRRCAR